MTTKNFPSAPLKGVLVGLLLALIGNTHIEAKTHVDVGVGVNVYQQRPCYARPCYRQPVAVPVYYSPAYYQPVAVYPAPYNPIVYQQPVVVYPQPVIIQPQPPRNSFSISVSQ